jgi:hypothetical protein
MGKQYGRKGVTKVKVRTFSRLAVLLSTDITPCSVVHRTRLLAGEACAPRVTAKGRQRGLGWMTFVIAIKLQVSLQSADKNIMRSRDLQCIVYQHISCPYLQTVNYQQTKVLEMTLPV